MPVSDGFELVDGIDRHPELGSPGIIMLCSAGEGSDRLPHEPGVLARLSKPVRQSELREANLRILTEKGSVVGGTSVPDAHLGDAKKALRILLAEDNARPIRSSLRSSLAETRYEVAVAGNGREALAAIEREPFAQF